MTQKRKLNADGFDAADVILVASWLMSKQRSQFFPTEDIDELIITNVSTVRFEEHIAAPLNLLDKLKPGLSHAVRKELITDGITISCSFEDFERAAGRIHVHHEGIEGQEYLPIAINDAISEYVKMTNSDGFRLKPTEKIEMRSREIIRSSVLPRLSGIYSQVSLNTAIMDENFFSMHHNFDGMRESFQSISGTLDAINERLKKIEGAQIQVSKSPSKKQGGLGAPSLKFDKDD